RVAGGGPVWPGAAPPGEPHRGGEGRPLRSPLLLADGDHRRRSGDRPARAPPPALRCYGSRQPGGHGDRHPGRVGGRGGAGRPMATRACGWVRGRLERAGRLEALAGRVRLAGQEPRYTEEQRRLAAILEEALLEQRFSPPSLEEIMEARRLSGRAVTEVWEALLDNGVVVRIAEGVSLHCQAIAEGIERVREHL